MRTFLASVLLLSTLAPLAPAANAVDACGIECIVAHPCYNNAYAYACVTVTIDCVYADATLKSQSGTIYQYVAGTTWTTAPVNVGPVHVSSVTVSTDPIVVGPIYYTTPSRSVSNDFCTSEFLA